MSSDEARTADDALPAKKQSLEIETLEAEIKEINQRVQHAERRHAAELKKDKTSVLRVTSIGLPLTTLLAAIIGMWISTHRYLDEQSKTRQIELNDHLVTLVTQLYSDTSSVRDHSALLLSTFEEDALPFLAWKLGRTKSDTEPILEAFRMIRDNPDVNKVDITKALLRAGRQSITQEFIDHAPAPDQTVITYVTALREFGAADPKQTALYLDEVDAMLTRERGRGKLNDLAVFNIREEVSKMRGGTLTKASGKEQ
jgi:hypothetical protein